MKGCIEYDSVGTSFFSWVCFYSVFSRRDITIKCVDDKTLGRTVSVPVLLVIQQASPHSQLSQEWTFPLTSLCNARDKILTASSHWQISVDLVPDLKSRLARPAFCWEVRALGGYRVLLLPHSFPMSLHQTSVWLTQQTLCLIREDTSIKLSQQTEQYSCNKQCRHRFGP